MNVCYLRQLSDLPRLCAMTCHGPTRPGKEVSTKRQWCLERATCLQRSIKASGWCSGQPGRGGGTTSNIRATGSKTLRLKCISIFTLVPLQLNKRMSSCGLGFWTRVSVDRDQRDSKSTSRRSSRVSPKRWQSLQVTASFPQLLLLHVCCASMHQELLHPPGAR